MISLTEFQGPLLFVEDFDSLAGLQRPLWFVEENEFFDRVAGTSQVRCSMIPMTGLQRPI